jgi:VanZ family protein
MSSPPAAADRAARAFLLVGFWVPLGLCTWLALTPSPPGATFRISDVALHAFAFSYLTVALGLAHGRLRGAAVAGWMVAYGILIEVLQSFQPARSAELKDLAVDLAGIAVGLALLGVLGPPIRRLLRGVLEVLLPTR